MYEEQHHPPHHDINLPSSLSHPLQHDDRTLSEQPTTTDTSTATFCNISLSTSFDRDKEQSELSLDWVLASGIPASRSVAHGILSVPCTTGVSSVYLDLAIVSSLPFDLILGRDWLQYCRESAFDTVLQLSDCQMDLRPRSTGISPSFPQNFLLQLVDHTPAQNQPEDVDMPDMDPDNIDFRRARLFP
ncbi:hypothetical protein C8J57DRAFT_1210247 [Mycena rebaudengoi]|nr:hypothetical protein C8J57DRAFT_1241718 [Mycena rebaudengoi]KAJ7292473.1 hypothetical protein C8J57DRAFT_1210247 [Mycena rebaudengoi]